MDHGLVWILGSSRDANGLGLGWVEEQTGWVRVGSETQTRSWIPTKYFSLSGQGSLKAVNLTLSFDCEGVKEKRPSPLPSFNDLDFCQFSLISAVAVASLIQGPEDNGILLDRRISRRQDFGTLSWPSRTTLPKGHYFLGDPESAGFPGLSIMASIDLFSS